MKEYKASLKTTTPAKKSPKKAAAAAATTASPTKAGSGSGFKSKEFIDESSSSEDSDDKPLKKKAKTEKPEKGAKKPKKVNIFFSLSLPFYYMRHLENEHEGQSNFSSLHQERQPAHPRKKEQVILSTPNTRLLFPCDLFLYLPGMCSLALPLQTRERCSSLCSLCGCFTSNSYRQGEEK